MQLLAIFGLLLILLLFVSIILEIILAVRKPDTTKSGRVKKILVRTLTVSSSILAVVAIGAIYYIQNQGA